MFSFRAAICFIFAKTAWINVKNAWFAVIQVLRSVVILRLGQMSLRSNLLVKAVFGNFCLIVLKPISRSRAFYYVTRQFSNPSHDCSRSAPQAQFSPRASFEFFLGSEKEPFFPKKKIKMRNSVRIACHDNHNSRSQNDLRESRITLGKIMQFFVFLCALRFLLNPQLVADAYSIRPKGKLIFITIILKYFSIFIFNYFRIIFQYFPITNFIKILHYFLLTFPYVSHKENNCGSNF